MFRSRDTLIKSIKRFTGLYITSVTEGGIASKDLAKGEETIQICFEAH